MTDFNVPRYVRESNLIENVVDPVSDLVGEAAWYWLAEHEVLTTTVVLDLHAIIMSPHKGTLALPDNEWLGCWRRCDVRVGYHVGPSAYEVPGLMDTWVTWMNLNVSGHSATSARSARSLHVEFERIHPFADGNGRTGRHLMWWHEYRNGLHPTLVTADRRHEYYRWFE